MLQRGHMCHWALWVSERVNAAKISINLALLGAQSILVKFALFFPLWWIASFEDPSQGPCPFWTLLQNHGRCIIHCSPFRAYFVEYNLPGPGFSKGCCCRGFVKGRAPGKLTSCERDLAINFSDCFHLLFLISFIRKSKNAWLKNPTDLLHKNLMKPLFLLFMG